MAKKKTKEKVFHVFVYGTLKKGGSNHGLYMRNSTFLGTGHTVEKYAMYESTFYPQVIEEEQEHHICGELYEVPLTTMKWLDALEHHPRIFKRKPVRIKLESEEKELGAWVYFYKYKVFGQLSKTGDFQVQRR